MFEKIKNSLSRLTSGRGYLTKSFDAFVPTVSRSGVPALNGEAALRIPAVLQAVRLIAENCGSTPLKAYKRTAQGKEALDGTRAYFLAHNRANEYTSAGNFRTLLTRDALLTGNGFAIVTRIDGEAHYLTRIEPSKVSIYTDDLTGAPVYRVTDVSGHTDYSFRDVLHISTFNGFAPIRQGSEAIGVASVLERHVGQLFAAGARPGVMITAEKNLDLDKGATVLKNLRTAYSQAANNGFKEPFIVGEGFKLETISFSSTDSQFLEHRREQVNEIARLFGVPPHLLFQLDRATWGNAEQMAASFLQLCLRPWLDRWQDAYNTVLFDEDQLETHYCEFVIDDLQRADSAGRADIVTKLISARVMTPNEVRATMNMPALSGGDELANPFTTNAATTIGGANSEPARDDE